jgi:hypothetical protein
MTFYFPWYLNRNSYIQEQSNEVPVINAEQNVTLEETLKATAVGLNSFYFLEGAEL